MYNIQLKARFRSVYYTGGSKLPEL